MQSRSIKRSLRKFRRWREGYAFTSPVIAWQANLVERGIASADHAGKRHTTEDRLLDSDVALLSKMLAPA